LKISPTPSRVQAGLFIVVSTPVADGIFCWVLFLSYLGKPSTPSDDSNEIFRSRAALRAQHQPQVRAQDEVLACMGTVGG
jgi:hypothetical protein